MDNKPINLLSSGATGRYAEAAYFFLRGFGFFFARSARSLCGMVSIRRASSSSDIGGAFSCLRLAGVIGVSRG